MASYLYVTRRNRFGFNPISAGDYYTMPLNAKTFETTMSVAPDPSVTFQQVLAPTPQAGTSSEAAVGLANQTVSNTAVYLLMSGTLTITIANPAVFTYVNHGLTNDQCVRVGTNSALPTGVSINTDYYIINATADTFNLATSPGGGAIGTSGTQSGTHSLFYKSI